MNHDKLINWDNEAFYIINLKKFDQILEKERESNYFDEWNMERWMEEIVSLNKIKNIVKIHKSLRRLKMMWYDIEWNKRKIQKYFNIYFNYYSHLVLN